MPRTRFECTLCLEDKFEAYPRRIGDSRICDACANEAVKPQFHNALEHEYQYPPMWGKEKLDLWTFCDLFDDEFRKTWQKKEKEYAMPVKERLYCEHRDIITGVICGEFLGKNGVGLTLCLRCKCSTCRACGVAEGNCAGSGHHDCKKSAEVNPFEKLLKGRHYQQCPDCEKEFVQGDGCNHMTCRPPCSAHFCFICGERVAARRSGHWQKGGCPRFGVSGNRRIWDNLDEHSEAGTDESDNNEGGEVGLIEHLRDVVNIERLVEIFDNAADAERVESNRMRSIRGVPSLSSEYRIRFFGYVSTNLAIVLQVMRSRFDIDHVPSLLAEFNERHRRINDVYRFSQENAELQVGTVTQLSDLSDEFDAYFVFALEVIADLSIIAQAHRRIH